MYPAYSPDLPPVRKGQTLTYSDLREEAAAAVEADRRTQKEIAESIPVSPGALSRAIKEEGPRYAKLQQRIIQELNPGYRLVEVGGFYVDRADA